MCILKILTIGDLHVNPKNINEVKIFTLELKKILLIENPDVLVFLGDQLDTMSKIDMDSLYTLTKCLEECISVSKNMVILVGNHCRHDNNDFLSDRHGYSAFKFWKNTTIVDNVITKEFQGNDGNYYKFLFVCYVPNNRFMEALSVNNLIFPLKGYTAGFCHHEFTGTDINNLTKSKTDTWPEDAFLMISGHLHTSQIVKKNLIYPGVPFQHSFNDSLLRTISIFEFSEPINGILTQFIERKIELDIPKKFTLKITPEELSIFELPKNSYFKLKVKGDLNIIKQVRKLNHVIELENSGRVKIIEVPDQKLEKNKICNFNKLKLKISFPARVVDKIKNSEDSLVDTYNKLFGTNISKIF